MARVIVKVQVSLAGTEGSQTLAYPKAGKPMVQFPTSAEVRSRMKGRHKAFFYAEVDGPVLILSDDEAPWQDW